VALPAGRWTRVLLDFTEPVSARGPASGVDQAGVLTMAVQGEASVYCDDVIVINNDFAFVDVGELSDRPPVNFAPAKSKWMIRQRGFQTIVERANAFRLALKTSDATAEGWTCVEANGLRAQFVSASGAAWTIYADGRSVREGKLDSLFKSVEPAYRKALADQHAEPGTLEVEEEFGRVNRESKGDLHNSGYNTERAVYLLHSAQKTRFEFKMIPKTRQIVNPTFEVTGLGKGNPVILVEGQLIDRYAWLGDGRLLVEIPLELRRGTTVNISMK